MSSSPDRSRRRPTAAHESEADDSHEEALLGGGGSASWESYDASMHPNERSSGREDRRKRFDATTPTLIDEEDYDEMEFARLSMDRSSEDLGTAGMNMRRTPGASQMHAAISHLPEEEAVRLGFLAGHRGASAEGGSSSASGASIWESSLAATAPQGETTTGTGNVGNIDAPFDAVAPPQSAPAARNDHSLMSPWKSSEPNRHGAFSPNLFRLTEDIGILLKDDEDDDDYALEIPGIVPGDSQSDPPLQDFGGEDWTGSFVFGRTTQASSKFSQRRTVARPSTATKEKARRRSQAYFLPHAQQPKPRRSGHEGALFFDGRGGDDRASPQLLNFSSGAFMPPKDVMPVGSAAAPFMHRPVASTPASSFGPPMGQPAAPPSVFPGFSFQPQVFQSLQPPGASPHRFAATPSPTLSTASSTQHFPTSTSVTSSQATRMQATAQVFVPRSTTPQLPISPSHWSTATGTTNTFERDWHASPFSYGPPYGYAMPPLQPPPPAQTFDARAAMTPSPLWPDAMLYPPSVAVVPPMSTPTPPMEPSYSLDATGYMPTVTAPPPLAPPEAKKKESRRKRGQKKKTKADITTTSKVAATATSRLRGASSTGSGSAKLELSGSVDAPTDEIAASASEDQGEAKVRVRGKSGELDESPATRLAFKNFYKAFRSEERHSFQKAEELALRSLDDGSLPESIHYKVYLELADLAKRSNRYVEARRLYQKVCQLQPYASQGWLEYSKLEEECGFMNRVTNILHAGLEYCTYSESLLTRAVKHQEKMGNLESARENLARLKHVGIDKVWRTVLEGALLESRAGNSDMARRVLKYLMHHVPWYGPLYLEAYKLERDQGHPDDALEVVQLGLASLPRYGPLWFGAFRLYEEMDFAETQYNLPKTMKMIERAKSNVSKELVWKVHLEAAQMLERTALLYLGQTWDIKLLAPYIVPVRERLVLTILTCPNNLRWKVWLAAGRMELVLGRFETARELFRRAHLVVQQKSRSSTLLDCVRLEEFVGETELARAVLCKARVDYGSDWKVWLESVLLEIRNCEYTRALEIADRALEIHTGTGRLWATLVQLQHIVGNDTAQMLALERALKSVPKSGEVWCEGGRIRLNPFSTTFDLDRARRCLYFAAKFTPQFGDSFVESLRIEILSQWLLPVAKYIWRKTKHSYLAPSGSGNLTKFIFDVSLAIAIARINRDEDSGSLPPTRYRDIVGPCRKKLRFESLGAAIDLTDIRLACANADPNYGSLWFHCRKHPTDTPRRVIEHAAEVVAEDLFRHAHIYLAAMVRRMAVLATIDAKRTKPQGIETSDPAVIEWETTIDTNLRAATSLADMLNPVDPTTGLVLLESTSNGSTFVTGLVELSRPRSIEDMPWYERRRAVFGTDALLP